MSQYPSPMVTRQLPVAGPRPAVLGVEYETPEPTPGRDAGPAGAAVRMSPGFRTPTAGDPGTTETTRTSPAALGDWTVTRTPSHGRSSLITWSTSTSDCAIERPPRPALIEAFPRMNVVVHSPLWDHGGGNQVARHPTGADRRCRSSTSRPGVWPDATITPRVKVLQPQAAIAGMQARRAGAALRSGYMRPPQARHLAARGTAGWRSSRLSRHQRTPVTASGVGAIFRHRHRRICAARAHSGGTMCGQPRSVRNEFREPVNSVCRRPVRRCGPAGSRQRQCRSCPARHASPRRVSRRPRPPRPPGSLPPASCGCGQQPLPRQRPPRA